MKKKVPVYVLLVAVVFTVVATAAFSVLCLSLYYGGYFKTEEREMLSPSEKVSQIEQLMETYYINETDAEKMGDAAAEAMIIAAGDPWAYYVPTTQIAGFEETFTNSYCGVGITIQDTGEDEGFSVTVVTEDGPAWNAGVRVGDVLQAVDGQRAQVLGMEGTKNAVRGIEGSTVVLTLLRDGISYRAELVRQQIQIQVVYTRMMDNNLAYIKITNFDEHSAEQTITAIEEALSQGAEGIVFDLRNNPGGHKNELVQILDYLLPEGPIFRDTAYDGTETVEESDASCVKLPMAVLINSESYSAAEFMAAALKEYDWAVLIGEKTSGKGQYQRPFHLSDGSVVSFSIGRYYTPLGKSLEGEGLLPDTACVLTEEQTWQLYSGALEPEQDAQLQTALSQLHILVTAERS